MGKSLRMRSFIIWNSCAAQAGWIPCRMKHLLACAFQKRSAGVPMSFFANRLQSEADADVILFGTAADASVSTAISAEMRRTPVDLTGKTAIADLPALLSQCHLFIGNDSGAMHVAAAVGLPVIAVFGPTDPEGTAPVTPRCSIVQQKSYCSPCFLRRCPTDHRCLTAITANMVEAAARPWLHSTQVQRA